MWVISILLDKGELQVFQYNNENDCSSAFNRLTTTKPARMIMWEPVWGTAEMHEFAMFHRS